jgi:hypothetical protein
MVLRRAAVLGRATAFGGGLLAAEDFPRFFEFESFFVFLDFLAEAFFAVSRVTFDFVFFAIAILLDISVFL